MTTTAVKVCEGCNEPFEVISHSQRFCSHACAGRAQSNGIETRECRGCGEEFQPRTRVQVYCNRSCAPSQGAGEMTDAELRAYVAGLMNWFCGGDPEKMAKLADYFGSERTSRNVSPTLAEVIGPYQHREVFFTDAD